VGLKPVLSTEKKKKVEEEEEEEEELTPFGF